MLFEAKPPPKPNHEAIVRPTAMAMTVQVDHTVYCTAGIIRGMGRGRGGVKPSQVFIQLVEQSEISLKIKIDSGSQMASLKLTQA